MLTSAIAATSMTGAVELVEIGGILLALGLIAYGAAKIGISAVPFFLVAGLLFGEGGITEFRMSQGFLESAAQIGALLLLLLLGLEYSAREIADAMKQRRSMIGMDALNALPGAAIGWLLDWGLVGAVALGGITYVSSSGIASQLIRDAGFQRSEAARRTVSVLVTEDLAIAPYLPLVTALATGIGVIGGIVSVSVALIITGLVLLLGVRNESAISRLLNAREPNALLLTVFGAALLAAGAATLVGFSGAVAAFLVGLLLTGEVAQAVRVRLSPLRDLFASLFFLFFGLATNPADIPAVLPLALLLTVVGVAGKMFVGWWVAKDLTDEMSWRRVGAFLVPRGEFSIVIAGLLVAAPFAAELQALTITYVMLTAIAGSVMLLVFRSNFHR
jgi:CPA2 family monovalent cation:H+ antiporter-2